ncbi:MAG: T9SS type A sorting domain-containing protein [Bacteroidota bacterium]
MKNRILILLLALAGITAFPQEIPEYPVYPVPAKYRLKSAPALPYAVNNTEKKYFPEVFGQYGMSCNQASSIGYVLNYELNRLRNLSSLEQENLCSPGFVYNFLNNCSYGIGVSYFDSWEVVKTAGCASFMDYPYYFEGKSTWMSGYDKYYRAMQNRITMNYSLPVGTPEGLQILKYYLYDHFEDSPDGGVGSIQIASGGWAYEDWTDPESGERWPVIYTFGNEVGHALTIAGYNDSVRLDINGDGWCTNDIDINDDGVVDMCDWEIGALLIVNSWGQGSFNGGKAYILYSVLTRHGNNGGIWGRSVHIVKAVERYTPQLTMRVVMRHEQRNKIRILAGIANDTSAQKPQQVIGYPMFNFMGDDSPLGDPDNAEDSLRFEFGLDITPLLTGLESGQPVKFFLVVEEDDPLDKVSGRVDEISVVHYNGEPEEYLSVEKNTPLVDNGFTYIPVTCAINYNRITVDQPAQTSCEYGESFSIGLQASGGTAPYRWELVKDYKEKTFINTFEELSGDTLADIRDDYQFDQIELPFDFPFYGQTYQSVITDLKGAIHFDNAYFQYPYMVFEDLVFKIRKSIVPFNAEIGINTVEDRLICRKTDSVVTIQWQVSYDSGTKTYPVSFSVSLYPDGTIEYLYGSRSIPAKGDYDWVAGISNGDGRFFKFASVNQTRMIFENFGIRFTPDDYPDDLSLTDEGLLSGVARDTNHIWNIRVKVTDSYNQAQYAAIPVSTVNWEETGMLDQNYPNPFNRSTAITFRIPEESDVTLEIRDFEGRKVKQILNTTLLAGEHTVYWNAKDVNNRNVNPGIYFYRLRAGERSETKRMVIVR